LENAVKKKIAHALEVYRRNAWGVFYNGLIEPWIGASNAVHEVESGGEAILLAPALIVTPFFWIAHLILLPFTLTVGAGLKTAYDLFTRKIIPEAEMSSLKAKVRKIDNEEMDSLIVDMFEYKEDAQSNSSKTILQFLKHNHVENSTKQLETKRKLILDYLEADHNAGKKLEHKIYDHFFPKGALPEVDEDTEFFSATYSSEKFQSL